MKNFINIYILLTVLSFININVNCKPRSNKDEWFVKRYKPEYLKKGDGKNFPKIGDNVQILFAYTHAQTDKDLFTYWDKEKPFVQEVGISNFIKCMDDTILRMSKGEKIRIFCSYEFGYGPTGNEELGIEQVQDFYVEIKLVGIIPKKKEL